MNLSVNYTQKDIKTHKNRKIYVKTYNEAQRHIHLLNLEKL